MKSAKIWTDELDQIVFKGILVFKRPLKTREIWNTFLSFFQPLVWNEFRSRDNAEPTQSL